VRLALLQATAKRSIIPLSGPEYSPSKFTGCGTPGLYTGEFPWCLPRPWSILCLKKYQTTTMKTVANLASLEQAQALKLKLGSAGITAFIPDEVSAGITPFVTLTIAVIRLQVADENFDEAKRIVVDGFDEIGDIPADGLDRQPGSESPSPEDPELPGDTV
jgi:hypothetical protein